MGRSFRRTRPPQAIALGCCLSLLLCASGCEEKTSAATLDPSAQPDPPRALEPTPEPSAPEAPDARAAVTVADAAPQPGQARDAGAAEPEPAPVQEDEGAAVDNFFGEADAPLRQALITQAIKTVKRGKGGRSLGFKITLEDGTKGYYKPEQSFSAANWYAEVAAYHLDRELGIGRVPPVVSRKIPWSALRKAAGGDKRRKEVRVRRDGTVRGAFVWWIPGGLRTMPNWWGWERWVRNRHWPSTVVTPFQRPRVWKTQLDRKKVKGDEA